MSSYQHETSALLRRGDSINNDGAATSYSYSMVSRSRWLRSILGLLALAVLLHAISLVKGNYISSRQQEDYLLPSDVSKEIVKRLKHANMDTNSEVVVERLGQGHKQWHKHRYEVRKNHKHITYLSKYNPPVARQRCDWVMAQFAERDKGTSPKDLEERYLAQVADVNVFYRATAHLFWKDYAAGEWGQRGGLTNFTGEFLMHNDPDSDDSKEEIDDDPENKQRLDGTPLDAKSVWTWTTGDQHLSNFGAWRNRHGDVVFGVNDFDEAAIYGKFNYVAVLGLGLPSEVTALTLSFLSRISVDFHIDVLRIAVSIVSHALTNGFKDEDVDRALLVFAESYVQTVLNYEDNEEALLFELTSKTAYGQLQKFLEKVNNKKSSEKQMTKFTTRDPVTEKRHFIKGPVDIPHEETHLAAVPPEMEQQIREAFTREKYGATMMKLGWAVPQWDDTFFRVLDVAERVGSGIGSYGVDRYYVLLKGRDGLLLDDGEDGSAIILDVKFEPTSAVSRALDNETSAWYGTMFANEAARVAEAQRRLTSYTDPYTGWVILRNLDPEDVDYGEARPFSVRQRSPWKDSPELSDFDTPNKFNDFIAQVAIATATSHVRGSVAKAPGDFKHVIATVLGGSSRKRHEWGLIIAKSAKAYQKQVVMDYGCFRDAVEAKYGSHTPEK
jgi:uncharacterized protein (DUF2252 family)